MSELMRSGATSNGTDGVLAPPASALRHPNKDYSQGGQLPNFQDKDDHRSRDAERETGFWNEADQLQVHKQSIRIVLPGRARQRGQSNVDTDRCQRCMFSHKGCDGVKPVCGKCRKHPERCKWPEGNPSRSGLIKFLASERSEENLLHSISDEKPNDAGIPKDGPASNNMAGAQLTTRDWQVQGRSVPENQGLGQNEQPMATVVLTQQFSVDQQLLRSVLPEMQRLEQVRVRVLESTRAYLGTDTQLLVNTQELRGNVSGAQIRHSQEQMGLQGSSAQVQQDSDFKSRIEGSEAGPNDDDVLRAWLTSGTL